MKKYKAKEGKQKVSNMQKCSCLQTDIKSITRFDLKKYKNHQNTAQLDQLVLANDENHFALPNMQKEIVGIFNLSQQELIKDVNIKQYNYTSQGSNKKQIQMEFSVTNQFLIIAYYHTVFIVNFQKIEEAPRFDFYNQYYQIEGTNQQNQLFLSYYDHRITILICQLEKREVLKQIFLLGSGFDQQFFLLSKNTFIQETKKWNKLRVIQSEKVIALKSRFYKKQDIFCFDCLSSIKIKNFYTGKLIKNIQMNNALQNQVVKAYFFKNDLLLQIRAQKSLDNENLKKIKYYEIHCFKFQLYEYWPNKVRHINEKLAINLDQNRIEFISY